MSPTERAAAPTSPQLSVVIASTNDGALLIRCLEALTADADPARVEVLVARDTARTDGLDGTGVRERFPAVRWIDAPPGSTVPRLRAIGIGESRGEIVGLLEDDCVVRPGWCPAAIRAHVGPDLAIGGAVEPGPYAKALDWGVYFCEYGRFMLPVRKASHPPLPGNNVTYKRRALTELSSSPDGFQEVFAHAAWQRAGLKTSATPALVVWNVNAWSLRHVTVLPYHHGRGYAAKRFRNKSFGLRVVIAVMALGLPVLKTCRIVASTVSRRRLIGQLLAALPWVLVFTASWSVGESVGSLFGPGSSPSRWR